MRASVVGVLNCVFVRKSELTCSQNQLAYWISGSPISHYSSGVKMQEGDFRLIKRVS